MFVRLAAFWLSETEFITRGVAVKENAQLKSPADFFEFPFATVVIDRGFDTNFGGAGFGL